MYALGMIETKGLIAAIEACDVMLKTANVELVGKRKSTATLVTILVKGDVAAVKASVEAGAAAAEAVSPGSLLSSHVIARPIEEIEKAYGADPDGGKKVSSDAKEVPETEVEEVVALEKEDTVVESSAKEQVIAPKKVDSKNVTKSLLDGVWSSDGIKGVEDRLTILSATKLRQLARQYDDIALKGRQISIANKKDILTCLKAYYTNK